MTYYDRAELGVDGNCGFALLGENIQEGESEFEEFEGDVRTSEGAQNAVWAAYRALNRLRRRLGKPISYYLGNSHPDSV